jgi:UDP-N-acetylglucosamine:LPS N-acetylglucosamine transferase
MPDTWAIVAGGGTAGHTLPGLAVAQALVARGHPAEGIHFVGSEPASPSLPCRGGGSNGA